MQQQPQLQGVADLLANQGRYGDSMLVHMNPIEVQGLASMSPTGSLTVNPQTGQPEAFLPFLAPLVPLLGGSLAGGALATGLGLGTVGTLVAKAAVSEGISALVQDRDFDPLRALASGATQFGIGAAADTLLSGADVAVEAGEQALSDAVNVNPEVAAELSKAPDVAEYLSVVGDQISGMGAERAISGMTLGEKFGEVVSRPGDVFAAISAPEALVPIGVGEGTRLQVEASEAMDDFAKDEKRRKKADYDRALAQRDANVFDPNITPDPFATGPAYGADYAQYANAGGIVSLDPSDFRRRFNGLVEMGAPVVGMYAGGPFPTFNFQNVGMGPSNPIPAGRQAALRGPNVISPQQLATAYQNQGLPGFGPEIMYFTDSKMTDPNPYEGWRPPAETPAPGEGGQGGGGDAPPPGSPAEALALYQSGQITLEEYLDMVLPNLARQGTGGGNAQGQSEAAAEVDVPAQVATTDPATGSSLTADEIADLYGQYMNYGGGFNFNFGMQEGGETQVQGEADRLIDLTQMAILGRLPEEEADVVIQAFVDEFGEEAFQALREVTLEQVVPGSQKEGEIVGAGGGMDDLIPGMIGDQQPVAVSPGEYIVPADVVSGIGDGSTDAGVQELDGMLDRVRMERTGTTQQPAPLAKGGMLPR